MKANIKNTNIMKMKNTKTIVIAIMFMLFSFSAIAGNKTTKIKTSAICNMCKDRIELTVNVLPGVKKSMLNEKTAILLVRYDDKKITLDEIRKAIAASGYDADDIAKDQKAYAVLPSCCKSGSSCDVKK